MISIVSNTWYAILSLLVLTIILHFLLVYPKNLSKKQWKRIDYLWISLTAIGLIGATNNVKIALNKYQLSDASGKIPFQYKYLLSFLDSAGSKTVCLNFVKNEFSPMDFDSVVADYDRSCEWSKNIYKLVVSVDTTNYQLIDTTKIPVLKTESNRWFKGVILESIQKYNILISAREDSKSKLNGDSDNTLLFFTPLLLILGLAIRITKVTGELMYEK